MSQLISLESAKYDAETNTLQVKADIEFEQFDAFAEPFAAAIDCHVIERQWGADRHQWRLEFEGCPIWFHYEFYGDICWLSVERPEDCDVLAFIATLLQPYIKQIGK